MLDRIKKKKYTIVYGAGHTGNVVTKWLLEQGISKENIRVCVSARNTEKNEPVQGIHVDSIYDLFEFRSEAIVLVAAFEGFFPEMDEVLKTLRFTEVIHIQDSFVKECIYKQLETLPIIPNKIFVENFHGLGYGDNPKYIVKEILRQKLPVDIVWTVKRGITSGVPNGVRTVEMYSNEFYKELSTAAVWISNVRKYQTIKKRPEQYYIQTWHGFTLKKIEKDAEEVSNGISKLYFDAGKKDSKMIDLLLSNTSFLTKVFRQTFWYDGEIAQVGSPRNDIFFQDKEEIVTRVRERYAIKNNQKIVLYAPTFRNNYEDNPFDLDLNMVMETLEEKYKKEYVSLLRLHPNICKKASNYKYGEKIKNATYYEDMMELLVACDILITDYSSSMFDYFLTKKPVFLYVKDLERYQSKDRGFYIPIESLPFASAKTNDSLRQCILAHDQRKYEDKVESFLEEKGFCDDGNASKKVVDVIKQRMGIVHGGSNE